MLESGTTPDGIAWEKTGSAGNAGLNLYLAPGQTVVTDKHAMAFMDGGIQLRVEMGGIKRAFGRMFSGETAFMSYFTGTPSGSGKPQKLTLGSPMVGDIVMIPLEQDKKWKLSQGAFMAGTANCVITGKLNIKGFLGVGQQEGAVLSTVVTKDGPGAVWLNAYGTIQEHRLEAGQSLIVDNEHFLATASDKDYTLVKVGNAKALIFGGEGLAMRFDGPCTVYTQSKGLHGMAKELAPIVARYMPNRNSGFKIEL